MTETKEFILDADTGQYLDDSGNTVAEVVGDGDLVDVTYIGDREIVEFEEGGGDAYEGEYSKSEDGDYRCEICGDETETEQGIKSHIAQKH